MNSLFSLLLRVSLGKEVLLSLPHAYGKHGHRVTFAGSAFRKWTGPLFSFDQSFIT